MIIESHIHLVFVIIIASEQSLSQRNPMRLGLIILCILIAPTADAGEMDEREEIHQSVAQLFRDGDFGALEEMAELYRSQELRTSAGAWKIAEFYTGISKVALDFPKDDIDKWTRAAESIDRWIEAYSHSPTPYVAKGAALMNRGWKYRGEGWSSTVEPGDALSYQMHAYFAAGFLIDNYDIASQDPHWYYLVVDSLRAFGADKKEVLEFAGEGFDRYRNYDPLYFEMAGYLSPKWRGSREELEAFAQEAVKQTYADRGSELYARIYWAAGTGGNGKYMMYTAPTDWELILKSMDEVLERYPAQWNIQKFAFFTCYKYDAKAATKYMDMTEYPIVVDAWITVESFIRCKTYLNRLNR